MSQSRNFHETVIEDELVPPSPRSTGIVFAVVALIVAVVFRASPTVPWVALGVALAFAAVAWAAPAQLEPLNRLWFKLGLLLNRVVSPVILALLYAIAIVPFGLAMQVVRDPLRRRRPATDSYWIERAPPAAEASMRNQF
jgi:hypothetical protein